MQAGNLGSRHPFHRAVTASQSGYTLLVVVALIAIAAIGLYRATSVLATDQQREQEKTLLRVGKLYADALQQYYERAPGSLKQYPAEFGQLLLDNRFVGVVRHLRQIYPDPLQPSEPWGLIRNSNGRITGVFSTSPLQPFLQSTDAPVANAKQYSDWKFLVKDTP